MVVWPLPNLSSLIQKDGGPRQTDVSYAWVHTSNSTPKITYLNLTLDSSLKFGLSL